VRRIGRFVLDKQLAEGGVAKVYLGHDEKAADEVVVIKIGNADDEDDFIKEAAILRQLADDRIVRVIDYGRERGKVFIAMEHVSGVDLHALLKQHGALPLEPSALVARDVAAALQAAHALGLGIVHRDVTPTNVLLSSRGAVKLADFGTAKWERAEVRTRTGIVKGKYEYLAPEQAIGEGVDHRTDVFCLGLVLYEMLSGARAYDAADPYDMIELAATCTLVPAKNVMPASAKALLPVVEKAIAKDPAKRFQSAEAMREAIASAVKLEEQSVRRDLAIRVRASRAGKRKTITRDD
jgi:eukaryotic-like serine/threonine-protein kinase